MEKIIEAFKAYFKGHEIELPQELEKKGTISQGRWGITYLLTTDEEGKPYLEFVASHPQTNMRHVKITQNGKVIALDAMYEDYTYNPKIEGDKERAEKEWREHNKRVIDELQEKGLL
jgi:hypothetical protein